MTKVKLEKELRLGRALLEKEVDDVWTNYNNNNKEKEKKFLGRDIFSGICMHNSFSSTKQDEWEKIMNDKSMKESEENQESQGA